MKLIKDLSEMIEEEISDAEKYARCALRHKEDRPALADTFYKLSNEEIGHANLLHTQIVSVIEEYRKANGNPPDVMLTLYEIYHEKYIMGVATVKGILALYK